MQFSTLLSLSVVAILTVQAAPAAPIVCNKACTFIYQPVCAQLKSGETQIFGNPCTLDVFNCENPYERATLVSQSACNIDNEAVEKRSTPLLPKCDIMCTMEYAPVCAVSTKNGKFAQTFSNKCALSVFNCENPDNAFRAVADNACDVDGDTSAVEKRSTPLLPQCNIKCTREYVPVCAVSSKNNKFAQTFSNKCTLSAFNCENPDNTFVTVANKACDVDGDTSAVEKRSTPLLPQCNIKCTKEFSPVCAVSSKNSKFAQTFNN
ncbi:hypothetical protein BGZ95_002864, partial [Linnemannia exigua]